MQKFFTVILPKIGKIQLTRQQSNTKLEFLLQSVQCTRTLQANKIKTAYSVFMPFMGYFRYGCISQKLRRIIRSRSNITNKLHCRLNDLHILQDELQKTILNLIYYVLNTDPMQRKVCISLLKLFSANIFSKINHYNL